MVFKLFFKLIARPQTVRPIFLLSLTGLFGVGAAFVVDELRKPVVAPGLAIGQRLHREGRAALTFDSGDQGFAPLPRVGLFPGEVVIKRPQHVAVAPDPRGELRSMVSKGPMKAQRRPSPSAMAESMSAAVHTPSSTSRNVSLRSAP